MVVDLRGILCVAPPIVMGAEGGGERVEVVDGAGELGAGRPRSMVSTATSTSLGLPTPMGSEGARIWCECDEDEEGGEARWRESEGPRPWREEKAARSRLVWRQSRTVLAEL